MMVCDMQIIVEDCDNDLLFVIIDVDEFCVIVGINIVFDVMVIVLFIDIDEQVCLLGYGVFFNLEISLVIFLLDDEFYQDDLFI